MNPDSVSLTFPPFRLEATTGILWRGKQQQRLRAQAAMVLQYLAERPGQLISKQELFTALWPDTTVSSGVLKTYVWEIRRALGDRQQKSRFIETIPRRGYRWVAASAAPVSGSTFQVSGSQIEQHSARRGTWNVERETALVGRTSELAHLYASLAQAMHGQRQIVFVSGEAGIGKTTLVDTFLFEVRSQGEFGVRSQGKFGVQNVPSSTPNSERFSTPNLLIGWGQCIEHYGTSEAYMPVLEALGRLCRSTMGSYVVSVLHQYAPTWLLQLPAALTPAEREQLQREISGATRERMLREMAEALEALSTDTPLILSLEDLHWSDVSTLDLITYIARRREPARVLFIGTYRSVETLREDHPLKAMTEELFLHQHGQELPLRLLQPEAVATYVTMRLPTEKPTFHPIGQLAQAVYQRTEGHPLFMVNVVEQLLSPREEQDPNVVCTPEDILQVFPVGI